MNKNEYVELHRLLAKLKFEIAKQLLETNVDERIMEYKKLQAAIDKIMLVMIIDLGK